MLEEINNRLDDEEWIGGLEDSSNEYNSYSQNKKEKKIKNSLKDCWDNIKHTNISETLDLRKRRGGKGTKNPFEEIMIENFPNLVKETDIYVWKTESTKKDKPQKTHTKCTIIQVLPVIQNLKRSNRKTSYIQVNPQKTWLTFSRNFTDQKRVVQCI